MSELQKSAGESGVSEKAPRILVARVGAIGDTLMATPLVRALRRSFPQACLWFLCSGRSYDAVRHNPHLDRVIPLPRWRLPSWLNFGKRRVFGELRETDFDTLLILESNPGFLEIARGVSARRMIAYGGLAERGGFERAPFDPEQHMILNHLQAAASLGVEPAGTEMELQYPSQLEETLEAILSEAGVNPGARLAGIHAGWGGRKHSLGETRLRSWPVARFAETSRWLATEAAAYVILTGSRQDQPLNSRIAKLSGVPCVNLAGKLSLLELAALIHKLDVYLTVDSGPAHMAAALGTPLVTLWGPGIFEQTAPLGGHGPVRILYHRVPCAPCYGTPLMKSCRDNICMKEIGKAEVQQALESLLVPAARPPIQIRS